MIEIDPSQWGLGSHLGNETTTSVPTLIPIESSNSMRNTYEHLDPQIKIYQHKLINKQFMCGI